MGDKERCALCGRELEWETCEACEDGFVYLTEADALWWGMGEFERCCSCGGRGGRLVCPAGHAVSEKDE